jgi:nitrogenase molybdenum-iron protein alpha/beta subunit
MKRGIQEASHILSFPYGRKAARTLGRRLKTPVIECNLPFGLHRTVTWLEQLGEQFGRAEEAQALIARELRDIMPRLEFVVPYHFLHRRFMFVGDPHLAEGFAELITELGGRVPFMGITCCRHNARNLKAGIPGTEILIDPTIASFMQHSVEHKRFVDLVVSCNTTGRDPESEGVFEFGFPSYERHTLYDRPFLGFRGVMAFADEMMRELRKVDQMKLRKEEDRRKGEKRGGPGNGPGDGDGPGDGPGNGPGNGRDRGPGDGPGRGPGPR